MKACMRYVRQAASRLPWSLRRTNTWSVHSSPPCCVGG
jgi:hypothetical protein